MNPPYLYEQLLKAQEATVATLADLAETAQVDIDSANGIGFESRAECLRIASLAGRTARLLQARRQFREIIDEPFLELIGLASMLHDVGNVTVADRILRKPGPLAPDERLVMQQHTVRGSALLIRACRMVEGLNYLELGAEIALFHHENFDGTGYPDGLAGNAIPLSARIVAVADAFDALTSDRPYRGRWSPERARAEIAAQRGTRFDPVVVDAFLSILAEDESQGDGPGGLPGA